MSFIITIRRAKTPEEMGSVYKLTHDTFVEKKLIKAQKNQRLTNNLKLDTYENTQVLIALIDGKITGTLSITMHQRAEEVYNYDFFSTLLEKHYIHGAPSFSGWRLATKGNPLQRYLVTLRLIIEANKKVIPLEISQAYFSFIPSQLKIYKNLFPNGEILGRVQKKTAIIDAELILMKNHPCMEGQKHLIHLYESILNKYQKSL